MGLPCFQAGKVKQARAQCGDEHSVLAEVVKSMFCSGIGMGASRGPASSISAVFTSTSPVFYFVGRLTWCKTKGTHEFNLQQDPRAGGEHVGNRLSLGDAANLDFPVPGGLCLFKLEADRRGEF